jgi:16S rRNA (cytosine967-C5)-methyltransferase
MTALEVVTRVRERESYAHETLDRVLGERGLEPRDAALTTRLTYGTIATRGTLDEAILRYVGAAKRLEPRVSDALALSAYELLFMRTPAHAAVSEGVEMARSQRGAAAGLANAVLRRLADDASDFPWGDPERDVAALARLHGHPLWIAQLWVDELGRDRAGSLMAANNEPAPLFLAHLPSGRPFSAVVDSLAADGARPVVCALPGCILARDASAARGSRPLASRDVLVMDAGAQFTVGALETVSEGTIVEIGAGRGSKTLLTASRLQSAGLKVRIIAVDLHAFKLDALSAIARDLGLDTIRAVVADAASGSLDIGIDEGAATAVLVDAPCSGLGTLRRHPDRRWRATCEEIDSLAELGSRLISGAARLVRPGGFMVYSTCTLVRRENEDVIGRFLASDVGAEFVIDPLTTVVPDDWRRFVAPEGWFRSIPEPGGPDGHFVARLKRR